MFGIRAEAGPVTPRGTLAHARRRPILIIDSGWPVIADEVNIDNSLLLPIAEGRTVCRLELMIHRSHWRGERLREPFPADAAPGSLVLDKASVSQRYFERPLQVIAAESKTRIRIVIDDRSATQLVALSTICVARLGGGFLTGFDICGFARK